MTEVKKEIEDQCPLNLRQVEAFLENYLCSRNWFISKNLLEFIKIYFSFEKCIAIIN
jgi:hypothetical protein